MGYSSRRGVVGRQCILCWGTKRLLVVRGVASVTGGVERLIYPDDVLSVNNGGLVSMERQLNVSLLESVFVDEPKRAMFLLSAYLL